jgi:hypothetical protein
MQRIAKGGLMASGWGTFFGTLMDKLPIQGRKERWKNELDKLNSEKGNLLSSTATAKSAARLSNIMDRIKYLETLLKNSATD